jgi:predicted GNAT family acetyltransferase
MKLVTDLIRFENASDFLDLIGKTLYLRATVNNLFLGICERLVKDPSAYEDPFYAAVVDDTDTLVLSAIMTPPHNIVLASGGDYEPGLGALVDYLLTNAIAIPGVTGPAQMAEDFAALWKAATGQETKVEMFQRVYELRNIRLPKMPSGNFRIARHEDIVTIAQWIRAFEVEALEKEHDLDLERAERFVNRGQMFVWDDGGKLTSMAMSTRPLKSSITVSAVYTPPELRRKGYATALVARLSEHLLSMGYEFINLFTDLENPTSNSIYQKIGYHPVADFRMYKFIDQ